MFNVSAVNDNGYVSGNPPKKRKKKDIKTRTAELSIFTLAELLARHRRSPIPPFNPPSTQIHNEV